MKILSLHCDYIKFKPVKKAIKEPEELTEQEKKEKEIKEVLVIFTAVEQGDNQETLSLLIENVKDIAKQVNCKKIVLYPYAHLSSQLANPELAIEILKLAEIRLKEEKFQVVRAPFGYYKEFELKCKGHPLAELSREIKAEGREVKVGETEKAGGKKLIEEKYNYKKLLREISKTRLDREKLKENDHRILGQRMDLFSFHDVAPGMVFWHNNGLIIYNELVKFWREEHRKAGYEEIATPFILDKKLWQISGHWEKYRESIFLTKYERRDFAVKPMNCPGGILIFKEKPKSYKDLPLRVAELGIVHRHELSGVLAGLFRVIKITQDDAHVYCTETQLESEIIKIMELVDKFYKKFRFNYHVELSTKPKIRIGTDEQWDKAEKVLEKVLRRQKTKYKLNKGEGAFYGPKIDFHVKDSLGRTWQLATIQLDFAMPERFDLKYTDKNNKKKRPVMIHRAIYGALERFIGILLEHTKGNLPTWLSPIQVRVLSFTDRNVKAAARVKKQFEESGIRTDSDFSDSTVNSKVRETELQKINYIIVIGDKEQKSKTLAVRERGKKVKFGIKTEKFINNICSEISKRK